MLIVFLAKYLILVFPLFLFYLLLKKQPLVVLLAGISTLISKFLEIAVGFFINKPRPFILNPELPYYREVIEGRFAKILGESRLGNDSSFFSAHSAIAFTIATIIYLKYSKKIGAVFFLIAGLVGLGRVLANVHYPIDVLVGGGVGILVGISVVKTTSTIS